MDDTWWHHYNKFDGFQPIIEAPWAQGADPLITQQHAQRSRAAESFLVSTSPEVADDEAYLGRGSVVRFKMMPNTLATRKEHIFSAPAMSHWDRVANTLKRIKAHINNGKAALVDEASAHLNELLKESTTFFPYFSNFRMRNLMLNSMKPFWYPL